MDRFKAEHFEDGQEEEGSVLKTVLIISLLAVPPVALKLLSNFFDNPYLQPLNLTREGLAKVGEVEEEGFGGDRINIIIDWGRARDGGLTRAQVQGAVASALQSQSGYYDFEFRDVPGNGVGITFTVGANRYGPFSPGNVADGMKLALEAQQMSDKPLR